MYLWCQLQVEQGQEIQSTAACACRVWDRWSHCTPVGPDPDRDGCPLGTHQACAFCCKLCVCFKTNPVIQVTAVPSMSPKRRDSHLRLSAFIMYPPMLRSYHNCEARLLLGADAKDLYLLVLISIDPGLCFTGLWNCRLYSTGRRTCPIIVCTQMATTDRHVNRTS